MAEGKRGTATVLFTDLVGSAALHSSLGKVAADDLRRNHDLALGAAIVERDGSVVKSIGDGIMATFGSAADAMEAGIAAQQAVNRLADGVEGPGCAGDCVLGAVVGTEKTVPRG